MGAAEARASLIATLSTVGVGVVTDVGQSVIDPPALVIVPPTLTYDAYCPGPTAATFQVPLIVRQDEGSVEALEVLLPAVEQAVHESQDAALTRAEPGSWGSPPLPCFLLTIEVAV